MPVIPDLRLFAWVQDRLIACADIAKCQCDIRPDFFCMEVLSKQRHSSVPLKKQRVGLCTQYLVSCNARNFPSFPSYHAGTVFPALNGVLGILRIFSNTIGRTFWRVLIHCFWSVHFKALRQNILFAVHDRQCIFRLLGVWLDASTWTAYLG